MCEKNSKGPNNIDPEQVDIPDPPPPPRPVIDWNEKKRRCKCSICKKRKIFPRGPAVHDAANKLDFVCSRCAEGHDPELLAPGLLAPGLVALLNLGRMAMADDMSAISALEGLSLHLKKYRKAVELTEQA